MADAKKIVAPTERDDWAQVHELLHVIHLELAALREALGQAGFTAGPKAPVEPSFGMSEGTRDEIERTGKSVDPFTGRTKTRDDLTETK